MEYKLIGVDVDDVLRDFVTSLQSQYNIDYPDHKISKITSWDLSKFFPIGDEIGNYFKYQRVKEIYEMAPMIEGADIFTQALKMMGKKVILLTAQPTKQTEDSTLNWIHRHPLVYDAITFCPDKTLIHCDIYLDDSPRNITALRNAGKRAIIFDRTWNRHITGERVNSLSEFITLLQ